MFFGFLTAAISAFLLAVSLRFATGLVFKGRPPNAFSMLFVVMYRVLFAASILFAGLTSLSCFGMILALFIAEAAVIAVTTRARIRRESLLSLMSLSTAYDLPLGGLVDAWRISGGLSSVNPETRLVELIGAGVPLQAALAEVPEALPGTTSVFVRAAASSGAVQPAFEAAIEQESQSFALQKMIRNGMAYLTIFPIALFVILSFMMLKIIPAFKKIFEDFGLTLPISTQLLISFSDHVIVYWPIVVLPIVLFWMFVLIVSVFRKATYLGGLGLLPGVKVLNIASLLRLLAVVVEQKQPLTPALELLAAEHPHGAMRRKIQNVLVDLDRGGDWCESLRRVKLIGSSDAALLQSAQRLGNLPWALRQTADSLSRRTMLRMEAAMEIVFPLLVIVMGICVGAIVIALFVPLIRLIQNLVL